MRISRTLLVAIGLILSLPALSGDAAETSPRSDTQTTPLQHPPESSAPTIHVYSRETIVDVTVTDDKDQPVHGLKQSDFTVEENGKPQSLRSFKEFGAEAPAAAHALPRLPPGVYTNFQSAPTTGPVNILLIDALNSNYTLVDYTEKAILKYLQNIPPGTQVAIFWLSESGLHLLQGFTSDAPTLYRAANTNRTDIGSNLEKWRRDWYTIDAFKQLSQYVAGIKGRKNLIWFTPGMPVSLVRDGGYAQFAPQTRLRGRRGSDASNDEDMSQVHRLMDAYELLSAEQVAVYPLDPRGHGRMGAVQLRAEQVAEESGGLALYNNNDIASLINKAIDHGAHYYTLSYVPPGKEDGHFHHIDIKVNRPGLHLVYRKGYNAETPPRHIPDPGAPLLKAAMEGVAPPATQLLFDAQVDAATPAPGKPSIPGKTAVRFNILYMLPQSQIAFADNSDGTHSGALEFDAIAYDNNRKRVGLVSQTMKLPLTPDEYQEFIKTPFKFSQELELPPGQMTIRVGVLDNVSNKVGSLEIPLLVSPTAVQQVQAPLNITPCPPRCQVPTSGQTISKQR